MAVVLANNLISNVPFALLNAEGVNVPLPSGGGVPSLDVAAAGTVTVGADNASVDFTPNPTTPDEGVAIVITMTVTNTDNTVVSFATSGYTVGTAPPPDTKVASGSFTDSGVTTRPLA